MAINRLSVVKFLELALTLCCVALHYKSLGETSELTIMLVSGTFVGYTIILIGLFAGYLISNPINKKLDLFFSLLGCAMFIASGVLILEAWESGFKTERRRLAISKGSLAIINGVLFFFDSVFTFRD
ncbi:uncharacterized protein LOC129762206 [Toxorhynchites rutilus septentrionalis]|uniref:uncharacterized protein LOC129762206 n=1 Tax=Toxorhynchites rutilus septentrionalis TaxID=329112 RepID=UPI0024790D7E|nr:uncharacterized protein LOC129762206 [Toxorhynchites rutilus septentrionalis]